MIIQVIRPNDGWVLHRMGDQLAEGLGYMVDSCTANQVPQMVRGTSVNIWINYAYFWKMLKRNPSQASTDQTNILLFTHREDVELKGLGHLGRIWDESAELADHCWAMSSDKQLPKKKTTVVIPAPDPQFMRASIRLGVCGKNYDSGRKGESLIPELRTIPGVEIVETGGSLKWEELPGWYQSIDYLLVLGTNEGGPMPAREAAAMGVPVIAPDVGFCWRFPCYRYSGRDELFALLGELVVPREVQLVYARRIVDMCEMVLDAAEPEVVDPKPTKKKKKPEKKEPVST